MKTTTTNKTTNWRGLFLLLLGTLLLTYGARSQVNYSQAWNSAGLFSWTGGGTNTTTLPCVTRSVRYNLYNSAPTWNFVSPSLGISAGNSTTIQFSYKLIDYNTSGALPNSPAWGTILVQTGTSASGPWTTIGTIDPTNHVAAATCAVKSYNTVPGSGSTLFVRFASTWSNGDYYLYIDEFSAVENLPACSGSPNAGTVVSSGPTSCATNFTLTRPNSETGVTVQWQQSLNIGGPYTNVLSGGNSNTYTSTAPSTPTYYQCVVTCTSSGQSATTTPVLVNPPIIAGGTAGITAAPGCSTPGFSLSVTGATAGTLTFQWEDSIPGGAWANTAIASASTTNATFVATANVGLPTYLRRKTICASSGVFANSLPVLVEPVRGGTAASTLAVCGDSITLSLTNNTSGAGVTYQWENSTDTLSWSPISGATSASQKTISPTTVTYYRCIVTCSSINGTSRFVTVKPVNGGTTTLTSSICLDSTTLSVSGASTGTGLSYDWVMSSDSITWTSTGITTATYKFPSPLSNTFYRRVTNCGVASDTSIALKVTNACQGFGPYGITRNTGITYNSIQSTGTTFTWSGSDADDDRTTPIYFPAGFNFTYAGAVQPAFYICTNGWLSFDTTTYSTEYFNDLSTTSPKRILAPFWEDLVALANSSTNRNLIKYQVLGSSPNRTMVIEWGEMERYNYGSPSLNFQIRLYEGSNNIEYVYGRMQPYDGNGTGEFTYSLGMTGNNQTNGQRLSLQFPNTNSFSASTIANGLSIIPECNTSYLFTSGGSFTYTAPVTVPGNDSSGAAFVLPVNPVPCTDFCGTHYTSLNATASNIATATPSGTPDDDIWFKFTAPVSGQVNINVVAGSGYNPAFQIMNTLFDTTGIGANNFVNSSASASESVLVPTLVPATEYLIRVFNFGAGAGSTSGSFSICINEVIPPPVNDDTTGAISLSVSTTASPANYTTLGATQSAQAACAGLADDDVWFKFTPNNITDTIQVIGTGTFRAHVQLLNAGLASLACQNTNTNAGTVKFAATNLKKDSTYFIRVYHTNSGTATANFSISVYGAPGTDKDLRMFALTRPTQQTCFPATDSVFVRVRNASFSNVPYDFTLDNINLNVRVVDPSNNTTTITTTMNAGTLNIAADTTVFVGTVQINVPGTYSFRAFLDGVSDTLRNNDSIATVSIVNNVFTTPFFNNVDSTQAVNQFILNGFNSSNGNGVGTTQSLRTNLYSGNSTGSVSTYRLKPNATTSFGFMYRITDWTFGGIGPATVLSNTDSICIEASTNCGQTYTILEVINGANHAPSTNYIRKTVNIGSYSPSEIRMRIRANWPGTANDAFIDIDSFFMVDVVAPTVATGAVSNLTDVNVNLSGNVTNAGNGVITKSGIVVSTTANPLIGNPGAIDSATTVAVQSGSYTVTVNGLIPNTLYYYRSYAINVAGTSYGTDNTFTTLSAPILATVSTIGADSVTTVKARLSGSIGSNGGSAILASGFVYGTASGLAIGSPSSNSAQTSPTATSGSFNLNVTGLLQNTKYYYRAYAQNGVGIAYGVEDSFTTAPIISALPYTQNFEADRLGWTTESVASGDNAWQYGTPNKTVLNGAFSGTKAFVTKLVGEYSDAVNTNAALISPQFDLTTAVNPVLRFRHKFKTDNDANYDGGTIEISIGGGAWTRVRALVGTGANFDNDSNHAWYNNASTNGPVGAFKFSGLSSSYSSNNNGWIESATYLLGAAGQSDVRFRFRFGADAGGTDEGWAIDDIEVVDLNAAPITAATNVVLSALSNTTATVSWTNGDGQRRIVVARLSSTSPVPPADNVLYNASPAFGLGITTGAGNFVVFNGTGSSVAVTNLTLSTNYAFDVYEYNGKYMHTRVNGSAATNSGTTLPVELTQFSATTQSANVILNWTTASEINNRGFDVERSVDGRRFEKVRFVNGAGSSNRINNYTLTDEKPFRTTGSSTLFYRLKQIDLDGKFTYSYVVKVSESAKAIKGVAAYPNPFSNEMTVSLNAQSQGNATIVLTDLQGRVASSQTVTVGTGVNVLPYPTTDLQPGVYFMTIQLDGETQILKVIKN